MREVLSAAIFALTIASAPAGVQADDQTTKARPEFRLLELGGKKVRWAVPARGLPSVITYAFLTSPQNFPGSRNCDAMLPPEAALRDSHIPLAAFKREVRAAFSEWEKAANIVFKESGSIADAGILIGADAKARGRAFTNVALREETAASAPADGLGAIKQSLICLNPQKPWKIGFDGNLDVYDVRFTVTHEIGHAIGLDHPSPEGQLMSFRYSETGRGLQPGDIAGAAALYGQPGKPPATVSKDAPVLETHAPRPSGDRAFGIGEQTR